MWIAYFVNQWHYSIHAIQHYKNVHTLGMWRWLVVQECLLNRISKQVDFERFPTENFAD
jgi:hypothetical protein